MALTTVNSGGIKDDSIVNADIKSDAAIAKSKLASLDIVNADINASAAIALSKLASTPAVLTGSTDNTICTVTGANSIAGESTLKWDGSALSTYRDSATTYGPGIIGHHQRGTIASPSVSQTDDTLLNIVAKGFDGTDYHDAARIDFVAGAGTPANNDMPGSIVFKTTDDGTGSSVTRLTIAQSGVIKLDDSATLLIPDAIQHTGDTNTQIRFPAADTVSVEAGGLEKLRIEGDYAGTVDVKGSPAHLRLNSSRDTSDWDATDPIGKLDYYVGLDTTNNLPYNAGFIHCLNETDNADEPSGALVFGTSTANASGGAVERFRITKDGHVGIGSTSPHDSSWGNATDTKFLHIKGTNYGVLSLEGTSGTNTKWSMGAGDGRFYMAYNENDSTHVLDAVRSTRDVEAMAGNFVLRAANKGIDFTGGSSVGTAANIMDDYEEGNFTPVANDFSGTMSVNAATYTKVGRLVHIQAYLSFSNTTDSSAISLGSLPFQSIGTHTWNPITIQTSNTYAETEAGFPMLGRVAAPNSTTMYILGTHGDQSITYNEVKNGWIIFAGTYQTSA